MIEAIHPNGYYIDQCHLAGETKAEEVFPAQHNTLQLSRDRWLVVYETRGFRGVDDNRSVVYQVRAGHARGEVLKEGYLDRCVFDWDPLGDGRRFQKLCNHTVVFGVPQGAVCEGRELEHAGHFVAAWRRNPRIYVPERDYVLSDDECIEAGAPGEAYRCYWAQFRLNAAGDDIELTQPPRELRERDHAEGPQLCRHPELTVMNQGYVNPVRYRADGSEWAFLLHWSRGACDAEGVCTPIRFRWNRATGLYEWVDTGPILDGPGEFGVFEGGVTPFGDEWLVSCRITRTRIKNMGNIWFRARDLFDFDPVPFVAEEPRSHCPRTTFTGPDGIPRVFTTDQLASPYAEPGNGDPRNPLSVFDIDPDDRFRVVRQRLVFDSLVQGLPIRRASGPTVHFCRLVAHAGGDRGLLTFSVRPRALKHEKPGGKYKGLVNAEEMAVSGVYCAEVEYDRSYPGAWEFADATGG